MSEMIPREEFIELLGFTSWTPTKRYIAEGIDKGLFKKSAIEVGKNDKEVEKFYYPKSWVGVIKADWKKEKDFKLSKPRAKASSNKVKKTKPSERTIFITLPNQQAYDLLIQRFKSKSEIVGFIMKTLEHETEGHRKQLEKELKLKLAELKTTFKG